MEERRGCRQRAACGYETPAVGSPPPGGSGEASRVSHLPGGQEGHGVFVSREQASGRTLTRPLSSISFTDLAIISCCRLVVASSCEEQARGSALSVRSDGEGDGSLEADATSEPRHTRRGRELNQASDESSSQVLWRSSSTHDAVACDQDRSTSTGSHRASHLEFVAHFLDERPSQSTLHLLELRSGAGTRLAGMGKGGGSSGTQGTEGTLATCPQICVDWTRTLSTSIKAIRRHVPPLDLIDAGLG